MVDQNWLPVGSFTNPDDNSQVDVFWIPDSEQLVLVGIGHEERLDSIGSLDESLQALGEMGITLS
jgi:hypothetical protein